MTGTKPLQVHVTAELIRDVLAGPCELGPIDTSESEALLQKLAREVWLVENRGQVVVHRPELRRSMLRAMSADPAQSAKLIAVHRAALQWYENRITPTDEDRAEALYHRLVIGHDSGLALTSSPAQLIQSVAQSADDFDGGIRAQLLYLAQRPINAADAAFLPEQSRRSWAQARADELVRTGHPRRAMDLWSDLGRGGVPGFWYAAAAFQTQEWRIVPPLADYGDDVPTGSLRYHYLLKFVSRPDIPEAGARLRHWLHQTLETKLTDSDRESQSAEAHEDLYFATLVDSGSALDLRRQMPTLSPDSAVARTRYQYLRMRKLYSQSLNAPNFKLIKPILSGFFRPNDEFFRLVLSVYDRFGLKAGKISDLRDTLVHVARRELSSDTILGDLADEFARAVLETIRRTSNEDEFLLAIMDVLSTDDPEWRVPIRAALLATVQDKAVGYRLAEDLSNILGDATPIDLKMAQMVESNDRSPRVAWTRAVEYLDRSGDLPAFMARCAIYENGPLQSVARAFSNWSQRRQQADI